MARPSPNRATGVGIVGSNPDQSPSSETGRAVVNVQLTEPGRRTRGSRVSPVRPALPKLLRTSLKAVDPQGHCECCGIATAISLGSRTALRRGGDEDAERVPRRICVHAVSYTHLTLPTKRIV